MVKKHHREHRTSKKSRRSSKKSPMSVVQLINMGKGIYAQPAPQLTAYRKNEGGANRA